jgi:cytochrome c biogenesis protein CcmG/thiol:disulfide interchange protein DsbE
MKAFRSHRVRLAACAAALVAVALIVLLATRPNASDVLADSPLLGKPAPAVSGTALTGGHVNLAQYRGRYVVINFFASWCPACQVEEPQLLEFVDQHARAHDAAVIGVVFSDTAGNALSFARSNGVTWRIVPDPAGKIALEYGVTNPPESFLIGPDGRVLAEIVGGVTNTGLDDLLRNAGAPA